MPHERLHAVPWDELLFFGLVPAEASRHQPPQPCTEAGVDPCEAPGVVLTDEIDLARSYQPRPFDVDQGAVEHVGAEQHLTGAPLELSEIELGRGGVSGVGLEPVDPPSRHEHVAAADARSQPDNRRQAITGIQPGHNVPYPSQTTPSGVEQGAAGQ